MIGAVRKFIKNPMERGQYMKIGHLTRITAQGTLLGLLAFGSGSASGEGTLKAEGGKRWFKGNTHTHTLWSDGDAAPEISVKWYRDRGYQFLCLSDHNILADREKWFPIEAPKEKRLTEKRFMEIQETFAKDWPVVREENGQRFMRLKTLNELKAKFEAAEEFLLIPAEEITAPQAVHINAVNVSETIPPQTAPTVRETLKKVFDSVEDQSRRTGKPMLAHLNHPNYSTTVTAEDIIEIEGERFFEIYNGHGGVRNNGDPALRIPSTDRLWDIILSMRLKKGGTARPLYGMGTDDTHAYFKQGLGLANAGRGWIMVLSEKLSPDAIIASLKRGDFYATSGVTLNEISHVPGKASIAIRSEAGQTYTTQFIGTKKSFDSTSKPAVDDAGNELPYATRIYGGEIGTVLKETTDNPAIFEYNAGEFLYVRAKIVSSKLKDNPHAEGDHETAWTQPVAEVKE